MGNSFGPEWGFSLDLDIYLFSFFIKKLRLRVDQIRPQFPDCIAYQKTGGKEKRVRIEFEFKSKNFIPHLKDPRYKKEGCDWIVCWEHNWPAAPKNIQIIELRTYFGLGFNVWIQPVSGEFAEEISEINFNDRWSVSSLAHKGDLVLYYRTYPDQFIKDIFILTSPVEKAKARYKKGIGYFSSIKRVCSLKAPIFLKDLKQHRILQTAGFVRGGMQGSPKATEFWPHLYDLIVNRNISLKKVLSKFAPDKI
jgi:hypothetical protein